jgi:hypothetical protein
MRVNDIEPLACGVARRESVSGEWRIVEYDQVGSTNLVAATRKRREGGST